VGGDTGDDTELGSLALQGVCGDLDTSTCDRARSDYETYGRWCEYGHGEWACELMRENRDTIRDHCGCGFEQRQNGFHEYVHPSGIEVRERYYCSDNCQRFYEDQFDGFVNDRSDVGCGYNGCNGVACQENSCRSSCVPQGQPTTDNGAPCCLGLELSRRTQTCEAQCENADTCDWRAGVRGCCPGFLCPLTTDPVSHCVAF
jgi:hypothetical protein